MIISIPNLLMYPWDRYRIDITKPASELPPTDQLWAVYQQTDVIVSICPRVGPDASDCIQPICDRVETLACNTDATAHVSIFATNNVLQVDALDRLKQATDAATQCGLERWAIVAEPTIHYALVNTIYTPRLDMYTTANRLDALSWARGDNLDSTA